MATTKRAEPTPEPPPINVTTEGWTCAEAGWHKLLSHLVRHRQRFRFRRRMAGVMLAYVKALQQPVADRNGVGGLRINYPGPPGELERD